MAAENESGTTSSGTARWYNQAGSTRASSAQAASAGSHAPLVKRGSTVAVPSNGSPPAAARPSPSQCIQARYHQRSTLPMVTISSDAQVQASAQAATSSGNSLPGGLSLGVARSRPRGRVKLPATASASSSATSSGRKSDAGCPRDTVRATGGTSNASEHTKYSAGFSMAWPPWPVPLTLASNQPGAISRAQPVSAVASMASGVGCRTRPGAGVARFRSKPGRNSAPSTRASAAACAAARFTQGP